jgi:hypothetical protein
MNDPKAPRRRTEAGATGGASPGRIVASEWRRINAAKAVPEEGAKRRSVAIARPDAADARVIVPRLV